MTAALGPVMRVRPGVLLDRDFCEEDSLPDVSAVLASAWDALSPIVQLEPMTEPILFQHDALHGPVTYFTRSTYGEIVIGLDAKVRFWAQMAYQAAHELTHACANLQREPPAGYPFAMHWLEESLCELASIFALRSMARTWSFFPPYRNWADYVPVLAGYAEGRLVLATETLAARDFSRWLIGALPAMYADSLRRADNTVVAAALLPMFEREPWSWAAVRYLNTWDQSRTCDVTSFMTAWRAASPASLHGTIRGIEAVLNG